MDTKDNGLAGGHDLPKNPRRRAGRVCRRCADVEAHPTDPRAESGAGRPTPTSQPTPEAAARAQEPDRWAPAPPAAGYPRPAREARAATAAVRSPFAFLPAQRKIRTPGNRAGNERDKQDRASRPLQAILSDHTPGLEMPRPPFVCSRPGNHCNIPPSARMLGDRDASRDIKDDERDHVRPTSRQAGC
ncbi:MAG: hypothetical protein JWQ55_2204 [Rhodopila sp.]|nr:hypothetical protein [Rhodopila sp.]